MDIRSRLQLLNLLDQLFDGVELAEVCFRLEAISYDNLSGGHKRAKCMALIEACERLNQVEALLTICRQMRPQGDWPALGKTAVFSNEHPVLIAEDDPTWQTILREILSREGFASEIAANYRQAAQLLRKRPFSALILDLNLRGTDMHLPYENGWHLARLANEQAIPIIIVTALASGDQANRALIDFGAVGFFDKEDLGKEELVEFRFVERLANAVASRNR